MLIILSILLLFAPTIFQYRIGNKSLNKSIEINYFFVCIISIVSQFIVTFLSFLLAIYAMTQSGMKCVTGAVGILPISLIITLLMFLIILIQFINRKNYN